MRKSGPGSRGGTADVACLRCSKQIVVERNMKVRLNRRFCSRRCWLDHKSAMTPKQAILCRQCGREFFVNANSHAAKRTFCGYECRSAYHDRSGDKNPRWKGGVSSERDTAKATDAYKQWRLAVYRRDGYRCVLCLRNYKLNAHHIKTFADHPESRFDVDNGATLCEPCHKQTYQLEMHFERLLRSRILRDFTSDARVPMDIVKIKSDLHGDMQRLAEMTSPASIGA